jgi:hypothetical protein
MKCIGVIFIFSMISVTKDFKLKNKHKQYIATTVAPLQYYQPYVNIINTPGMIHETNGQNSYITPFAPNNSYNIPTTNNQINSQSVIAHPNLSTTYPQVRGNTDISTNIIHYNYPSNTISQATPSDYQYLDPQPISIIINEDSPKGKANLNHGKREKSLHHFKVLLY